MKSFVAAVAFFALSVVAQTTGDGPKIETPSDVTVCRPTLLKWSGGKPPYFLIVVLPAFDRRRIQPVGQPSAPPFVDFGKLSSNSVTWNVNLGQGTTGYLNLKDSNGATGQSAPFTVVAGSDTDCVTASLSASAGPDAPGASASSPASTTGSGTAKGTSTGSSPSPSKSGAAGRTFANVGAAAALGAAVIALA